ncbi:ferritin-like domain-containing protein [Neobacillus sp. PS3-34]|uniref:ferritin-like domain-containing protein n=1 Tax=Neobacillus sp. PS3-34 TaxID=3070678 RepID=UPI0027DFE6B6|nr:ferritin-like domain-containing protein [Neobacillus sp. PS3-34]WML48620.1 ferritin-like domain-containing protein [Neobacillus sp. PS3-34]
MYDQQAFQQSLQLIAEAVQGEKEDQIFYDYLITKAPTKEHKEIITSIRNDEIRHNKLFKEMYKNLTGHDVVLKKEEEFKPPATFKEGIKNAMFGELKAMEKYRVIRQGLPYRYYRDIVFGILTDELKHADLYNFINTEIYAGSINENADTLEKTPDEWIRYTEFLVNEGLKDLKRGINSTHVLQEFILMGVLVGKGYSPEKAFETVEEWEKTGKSKLLQQSKSMRP